MTTKKELLQVCDEFLANVQPYRNKLSTALLEYNNKESTFYRLILNAFDRFDEAGFEIEIAKHEESTRKTRRKKSHKKGKKGGKKA